MDVLGCLLSVVVHAANIHDTKGGISTAKQAYDRYPSFQNSVQTPAIGVLLSLI